MFGRISFRLLGRTYGLVVQERRIVKRARYVVCTRYVAAVNNLAISMEGDDLCSSKVKNKQPCPACALAERPPMKGALNEDILYCHSDT